MEFQIIEIGLVTAGRAKILAWSEIQAATLEELEPEVTHEKNARAAQGFRHRSLGIGIPACDPSRRFVTAFKPAA
jgi:hypothetical protein